MVAWEAITLADQPPFTQDSAEIWRAADKIVYSKMLETVSSARTRIERDFDPEAVRQIRARGERDLTVGGPRRAGDQGRGGRRVASVHRAHRGGRRQTVTLPSEARTAGRTPFRKRMVHSTTAPRRDETTTLPGLSGPPRQKAGRLGREEFAPFLAPLCSVRGRSKMSEADRESPILPLTCQDELKRIAVDDCRSLAKVGVAGSNPVVRSTVMSRTS
jgi:hypothetical protein